MDQIRAQGIGRLACLCLAPQFSEMSVGLYIKHARESAGEIELSWAKSYHDEPLFIDSFSDHVAQALACQTPTRVLFTAHSLPAPNEVYEGECRATAAAVAARLHLTDWEFAFQSQGMSGGAWLGPTVESCLDRYAAQGLRELAIAPIGFVCDHVEILYDIDIHFRDYALARGIRITRPESLNGSPKFTQALAKVAAACLA
jgi:ferrochelatase